MKKYSYYYNGMPISKSIFLQNAPENWEKEVKNGEFSYGYYTAVEIE